MRGDRPPGVEAFSALQLLVERSQARFTTAFASRSEMYQKWYSVALDLERQFGPDERVLNLVGRNGSFTFKKFEKAQLQGNILITIEDGTNIPKTPLGRRAAMEHAHGMGLLGPEGDGWESGQRYRAMQILGVEDLNPSLDDHTKTALSMQDEFEQWAKNGAEGLQEAIAEDQQIQQQAEEAQQMVDDGNAKIQQDAQMIEPPPGPDGMPAHWVHRLSLHRLRCHRPLPHHCSRPHLSPSNPGTTPSSIERSASSG